jgi:integrase
VWHRALEAAGVEATRANGMHALRHFYASVLIDAGESVRAVAEYLGHAIPASRCGSMPTCSLPQSGGPGRRRIAP